MLTSNLNDVRVRVYACPWCHLECERPLRGDPRPCERCREDLRGVASTVEDRAIRRRDLSRRRGRVRPRDVSARRAVDLDRLGLINRTLRKIVATGLASFFIWLALSALAIYALWGR